MTATIHSEEEHESRLNIRVNAMEEKVRRRRQNRA